jgi:hypothetical protein
VSPHPGRISPHSEEVTRVTLFLRQQRVLYNENQAPLPEFPADVSATILLAPEDAFGVEGATNRRVLPVGKDARLCVDINEGRSWHEGELVSPLALAFAAQGIDMALNGNRLLLRYRAESAQEAVGIASSVSLLMPPALTFRIGIYVWIKQFLLNLAGHEFNFGVSLVPDTFLTETSDGMASRVQMAIEDWLSFRPGHERLISALSYYRHAKRISELQPDQVVFVAEVLLNLAKAIEILMAGSKAEKGQQTNDRVRARARSWGFTDRQIEEWIIPILLLRNQVDIAHASLTPLSPDERSLVIDFSHKSLERVGQMLADVLDGVKNGRIVLDPVSSSPDSDRRKLLAAIAEYVNEPKEDTTSPGQ